MSQLPQPGRAGCLVCVVGFFSGRDDALATNSVSVGVDNGNARELLLSESTSADSSELSKAPLGCLAVVLWLLVLVFLVLPQESHSGCAHESQFKHHRHWQKDLLSVHPVSSWTKSQVVAL